MSNTIEQVMTYVSQDCQLLIGRGDVHDGR